jgi:aspartate carbamoyltransferase regulatory subunit
MSKIESFEQLYTYQSDLLTQKIQLAVIETFLMFKEKDTREYRIVEDLYSKYQQAIQEKTDCINLYLENHSLSKSQLLQISLISPRANVTDNMYSFILWTIANSTIV